MTRREARHVTHPMDDLVRDLLWDYDWEDWEDCRHCHDNALWCGCEREHPRQGNGWMVAP